MRILIRVAFAALSLATITPVANAAGFGASQSGLHQGAYDNTGHGPQETGLEGGGG